LTSRTYSSPLREEQARQTQRRILDAAYDLFLAQGYTATTVNAIAAAAGVSAQTVYKAFGTKPALVKRLYDVRLVGDEEAVPLAERPEVRALYAEEDPRRFLAGYARLGRELLDRLGPLVRVLLAGARAGDPDLREFVDTVNGERLVGTGMTARRLAELGALRAGLSVERARDAIWTLNSVEVWSLLTEERGWSAEEYEQWVGRAMVDAVLAPG
jgi:AcrR family transcriptional regulator